MLITRGWSKGEWRVIVKWVECSEWNDEKFWRCVMVMVAQQCECTQCHGTVHLKMVKTVNFMLCLFYHNKKMHGLQLKPDLNCQI